MKPNTVKDYNAYMSGIDRADQMLSYHSALRKTLRWYKKVGIHLLEIFLYNAHYLYNKYSQNKMTFLQFREAIVSHLVGERRKERFHKPKAEFHYLAALPPTQKKKNPTNRCVYCSKSGVRHESRYFCEYCPEQPTLCVDPCFRKYHEQLGVSRPLDATSSDDSDTELSHLSMVK